MADIIGNLVSITWWRTVFQKTSKGFGWGCAVVFALPLVIGFGWNQYSGHNAQNTGAALRDALLMKVNGEPVQMGEYYAISQQVQMGSPGESFARTSGEIVSALVQQVVLAQEAKRSGAKPNDADIDKAVQDFKIKRVGPKATDADLEAYLFQAQHLTTADLRQQIAKSYLQKALFDDTKKKTVVTEEEARNQSAEVRMNLVLIPTAAAMPGMPRDPKALPDADAKKKAEDLLAQVKSGKADIVAIAKASSSDFHAKMGGDTNFMPEYTSGGMPESMGILGFGKELDEAVHKAKPGDFVGVIKATGFQPGYLFAKIAARRDNLPKDFAPQKAVDLLKEKRAKEVLTKRIDEATKAAKVDFDPERVEQKAFYHYFLYSKTEQERMMAFGSPTAGPSEEELNRQKATVDSEIEALYKKDPTNTTAAVLILDSLKMKMMNPKTPPDQQTQARERLLTLYQTIIKSTEGEQYAYRFGLAEALRDKKQFAEAYKNYQIISKGMNSDSPTDLKAMEEAKSVRQRLALGLKSVASPEVPKADADAAQEQAKIQELDSAITVAKLKEAEDKRAQEEERKKQAEALRKAQANPPAKGTAPASTPPDGFGKSLNLPPGGKQTITIPGGALPTNVNPMTKPPAASPPPPPNGATPLAPPPDGAGR